MYQTMNQISFFGSIEFFITIDGYIKNSIEIPLELLQKINENTDYSFLSF